MSIPPAPDERIPVLERFKYVLYVAISIAIVSGIAVLLLRRPKPTTITLLPPEPTPIPSLTPLPSSTPTPDPYIVYVTGAIARPGSVITLPYGSRVLDALEAAGGPLDNANLERVNLAQILNDGDQIHVPTQLPGEVENREAQVRVVTLTPGNIIVYVTGEVQSPQALITLPAGSRVDDAIKASGGTTTNANLDGVNLSQILNDGDLVHVPPLVGDDIATPTPNRPAIIHVNWAEQKELETLPGIGPALAQAIIDYRTENGPFDNLEALGNVPGIGPAKLEAIRDLVVFD